MDQLQPSTNADKLSELICIRFDLKASYHDVAMTSDRPNMEVIRQGLKALDQKT